MVTIPLYHLCILLMAIASPNNPPVMLGIYWTSTGIHELTLQETHIGCDGPLSNPLMVYVTELHKLLCLVQIPYVLMIQQTIWFNFIMQLIMIGIHHIQKSIVDTGIMISVFVIRTFTIKSYYYL